MPIKPSYALLAALALIAAPAHAQDDAAPAAEAQSSDAAAAPAETDASATATTAPAETDASDTATTAPAESDSSDTATGAEAPADATPASDAAPIEGEAAPAAGATADAPKPGTYFVKSTHQDWTIRCVTVPEGQKSPCELYQLMKDAEGNSVAEVTMIPLKNGKAAAGATLIAPLETDLQQGLGIQIDGGEARGYPFSFCAPVGCVSRMGFTEAELNSLKRGNKAQVRLLPFGADPKSPVVLNMSLSGFTAAMDELTQSLEE